MAAQLIELVLASELDHLWLPEILVEINMIRLLSDKLNVQIVF